MHIIRPASHSYTKSNIWFPCYQHLLSEYSRIRKKTPPVVEPLMEPHIGKVEAVFEPGLTLLNWTSINIDAFIENAWAALGKVMNLFQ